jgi:hypothetical protein
MSDGTTLFSNDDTSTPDSFAGYASAADRTPEKRTGVDMHVFAEWLPRLSTVLWLYREPADPVFPRARLTSEGVLLLEHPALVALANCTHVHARSSVTTRGPREWIDIDADQATIARLYLLPDTDCMAWDGMLEALGESACVPVTHERHVAGARGAHADAVSSVFAGAGSAQRTRCIDVRSPARQCDRRRRSGTPRRLVPR